MKKHLLGLIAILAAAAVTALPAGTNDPSAEAPEYTAVIALKTDEFELEETDISHLGVGESETIVTDDGTIIDLLRTLEGVEIYVDGALLDTGPALGLHAAEHEAVHGSLEQADMHCNESGQCKKIIWITHEEGEFELASDSDDAARVLEHHVEIHCVDAKGCAEELLLIGEEHETGLHAEPGAATVHIMRLHDGDHADGDLTEKEVIVIQEHSHD